MSVHFVLSELSCGSLSEHKIMKKIVGRLDHTLNHFPSGRREKKRERENRGEWADASHSVPLLKALNRPATWWKTSKIVPGPPHPPWDEDDDE